MQNPKRYFWLRRSCAAILIGRLATIPAHALTVSLFVQNALSGQLPAGSMMAFSASYALLVALLYQIGPARSRAARLYYALTHWLYWLCMLPAFLNAMERMTLGQVDRLKSPHVPFVRENGGNKTWSG